MNDQTISELDEAIQFNPEDATAYINRGYTYYKTGDYDRAIEDYDNAVRLCSNYETDFIESYFVHGGQEEVRGAVELLNRISYNYYKSGKMAAAAYYSGVSLLFAGNKPKARRRFENARELGFEDDTKIAEHLENLKSRK